ncbi:MAG: glycoside hydrolase family 5 protein [Huintestinicola sp.]
MKTMRMHKIAAAVVSAVMIMGCMAGCGGKNEGGDSGEAAETEVSVMETQPMRDIPSIELVKEMKIGWNLGNTLDSTINNPKGDETVTQWECAWGQPVTTKLLVDRVAEQGFNVFRLPVTWDGKFGEGPDYKIREDWLARVKEIVDYARDNDMFVILNMHHEEWNMPTAENEAKADEILRALWTQIAEYFKDYNEMLIFEGMNEPRLKNTPMEWNGGNHEAREVINHWNAAFVETVRATGGNNAKRHLMIPTYAASTSNAVLSDLVIPDDDKVIVSVHAYLPYTFALADDANCKKTWSADEQSDTMDIDTLVYELNERFISKGQAVILGEFGTRNRFNTEDRAACALYYTSKLREVGIPAIWWDNNAYVGSGENFGLIDRTTYEWRYPDIIDALMKGAGVKE